MSAAEANLDDFFRKRDKKKKSSKSTKFSKIDNAELASHLDAVSSNVALIDDEQQQQVDTDIQSTILAPVVVAAPSSDLTTNVTSTKLINKAEDDGDDEWKQFETDENRNYSGLKINFLRTNESDEENEEEVDGEVEKKSNCPWLASSKPEDEEEENKNDSYEEDRIKVTEEKRESEKVEISSRSLTAAVAAPAGGSSYVPPHLRSQQQQQSQPKQQQPDKPAAVEASQPGSYVPPYLRKTGGATPSSYAPPSREGFQSSTTTRRGKNQPNINDECEFPSLSDVKPVETSTSKSISNTSDSKYEQTTKRSSKVDSHPNAPSRIGIENKFNALSQ